MESYVKDALLDWKEEMLQQKIEIDEEYEKVKSELQLYSYKSGITKQVIQSTINDELINNIKTTYQIPFVEKYEGLKQYIKELDEKRKVFQMFVDKIEKVSETGENESRNSNIQNDYL
jgi:predicted patatin/cPLA2 family phospholipase